MANEVAKKALRGIGLYLQAITPPSQTGLTVTITPIKSSVVNEITGVVTEVNNATVDGEFYSLFAAPGSTVAVLSVVFKADENYFLSTVDLEIENEAFQSGRFITKKREVALDRNKKPVEVIIDLIFNAGNEVVPQTPPAMIHFIGEVDQVASVSAGKLIKSTIFPVECSNIQQNLSLGLVASIGSQFKVTCTASGITNIIPDNIHTVRGQEDQINNDEGLARYEVRVPIPARSTDTTWTITVVPESGTDNTSDVAALTLLQRGLKTITFTDDVTGISNTTFPDNVTTLSHGSNVSRKYYEVDDYDLNSRRKDYQDISIDITASSGTLALKAASPVPTLASSFTNIKGSSIIINSISTSVVSSSVVRLKFKMKVPRLEANLSSAIKLSDFLTNS